MWCAGFFWLERTARVKQNFVVQTHRNARAVLSLGSNWYTLYVTGAKGCGREREGVRHARTIWMFCFAAWFSTLLSLSQALSSLNLCIPSFSARPRPPLPRVSDIFVKVSRSRRPFATPSKGSVDDWNACQFLTPYVRVTREIVRVSGSKKSR